MQKSGTGRLTGSTTGFIDIDKYTTVFKKIITLSSRRLQVGKTAFGLSLAYNMAVQNNRTVGFFSLEMGNQQLMQRLVFKSVGG